MQGQVNRATRAPFGDGVAPEKGDDVYKSECSGGFCEAGGEQILSPWDTELTAQRPPRPLPEMDPLSGFKYRYR